MVTKNILNNGAIKVKLDEVVESSTQFIINKT